MDEELRKIYDDAKKRRNSRKNRPGLNEIIFEHGKIPPQAIDIEEVVLGACMLDRDGLYEVVDLLKPEVFYKEQHQIIFAAIIRLFKAAKPVDILTIKEELSTSGELERSGGAYYLTILVERVSSALNIEYHSRILIQKFISRELIRISSTVLKDAYEDTSDCFDMLDNTDQALLELRESTMDGGGLRHISSILDDAEKELNLKSELSADGKIVGVKSGLAELDKATNGWMRADLVVLAARPSMGKTALMLKFARSAAEDGSPVAIFSLEMRDISLADRMILSVAEINTDRFKTGKLHDYEWTEYARAKKYLSSLPIYIDSRPAVSPTYMRSRLKLLKKKGLWGQPGKKSIFMGDHLHLASTDDPNAKNREQEVSGIAKKIKTMAKEFNEPAILLCQLSRETERRGGKDQRPRLSDLRDSGGIEEQADQVIFIYRPAYYGITEDEAGNSLVGLGELNIEKFRDGALAKIPFRHNFSMTRIYDHNSEITEDLQESTPF